MKKVFCIYPPSPKMNRTARCQQPVKELIVLPPLPPTDLMYCAAVAREIGAVCKIKDYSVEGGGINILKHDISDFTPDIVLINVASTTFENDINAVKAIKEVSPKTLTVLTGAHFLTFNTSVLDKYPFIDIIIRGEPEMTFKEIVSGKSLEEINGITFRNNESII
ncbi:MAG: cobalamin-dependent protein, partial [Candidatus Gastranaerophilaceae bacterium]